ncbi:hypothetical protein [Legionella yabuuchiae]|uniref:hypothetical protein n=1 Tax=Legionella yabuuchiae TaxID=376727 RepID=UPI0010561DDA|nr:hypothetical protein [Legionella yabuuchiae]
MASKPTLNIPLQAFKTLANEIGLPSSPEEIKKMSAELNTDSIHRVRRAMDDVFESVNQHDSPLDWLAKQFALLPIYIKIPLGLALTGGAFFITYPFLAGIAALGGIGFVITSIFLHMHASSLEDKAKLIKFLSSQVGEMLESIFVHLAYQALKLEQEVQKFTEQNIKLKSEVTNLEKNIDSLDKEISKLKEIHTSLLSTSKSQALALKEFEHTKAALHKTAKQLEKANLELSSTAKALETSTNQLIALKEKSALEIRNLKLVNQTLKGSVESLSQALVEDETKRSQFVQRLNDFLSDSSREFHSISERICQAEAELSTTKTQLQEATQKYSELLTVHTELVKKQDEQVTRLEAIGSRATEGLTTEGVMVNNFGIFSKPKNSQQDQSAQIEYLRKACM